MKPNPVDRTLKTTAVLTLKKPGLMKPQQRKEIADWLRRQAAALAKSGDKYTNGRFTARFWC